MIPGLGSQIPHVTCGSAKKKKKRVLWLQITEIDFYQLKENVEFIERILAYVIVIKADWNKWLLEG